MRRLERSDGGIVYNRAARLLKVRGLRNCNTLSACGDNVLRCVAEPVPRAFVKALIEPRELNQRAREFDF